MTKRMVTKKKSETWKRLIELISRFYPLLYLLERTLKKKVADQIEERFGTSWLKIISKESALFKAESQVIAGRKGSNFELTERTFVREASFGFWVELFKREHYKMLKGIPIKAFDQLPGNMKRIDLYRMLSNIKHIRNSLYHHKIDVSRQLTGKEREILLRGEKELTFLLTCLDKATSSLIYCQPH